MTAQEDVNKSDNHTVSNHSDFSIEHILNRAGSSSSNETSNFDCSSTNANLAVDTYSWLQCTRYCPPKVPRVQKKVGPQRRQLGRHPRIPFTSHQLSVLEEKFQQSQYLSSEEVIVLATQLQLADARVKIWFQNRRARERREKIQNLKQSPDAARGTAAGESRSSSPVPQVISFFPVHNRLSEYLIPPNNQIFRNEDR